MESWFRTKLEKEKKRDLEQERESAKAEIQGLRGAERERYLQELKADRQQGAAARRAAKAAKLPDSP